MAGATEPGSRIYVSYGADVAQTAEELIHFLRQRLGADRIVTRDDLTSFDGTLFASEIEAVLQSCLAVIAILGKDSFRREAGAPAAAEGAASLSEVVGRALADDRIITIPVLVEGAEVPAPGALPPELEPLAELRPFRLTDDGWEREVDALVQVIHREARVAEVLTRARAALDAGRFESALDTIDSALSLDPVHAAAARLRAQAARAAEQRELETLARDAADRTRAALAAGDCDGARRVLESWPTGFLAAELELREELEQSLARAQAERSRREREHAERSARESATHGAVSMPWEGTIPPPSPAVDENVQFTVFRRSAIQPERWYPLLVFAHLSERRADAPPDEPDPMAEVQAQASQVLGDAIADFRCSTEDSGHAVARDGELRVVPRMDGVTFNPPEARFLWTESVHREDFRLRAVASMHGRVARGTVTVFAGNLILADVQVSIRVDRKAANVDQEFTHARAYRRIFASYSHRDTSIVEEFESHAAATGDQYLRDVVSLRAGEVWDQRLLDMIKQADVFQLFWSWNALASPLVREEWQQALALNRPYFVRPVYWEEPLPEQSGLPPEQLRRLHFQRVYPRTVMHTAAPHEPTHSRSGAATARPPDTGVHEVPRSASSQETPPPSPQAPRARPSMKRFVQYGSIAAACVLAVGLYVATSGSYPGQSPADVARQIDASSTGPRAGGGAQDPEPGVFAEAPAQQPSAGGTAATTDSGRAQASRPAPPVGTTARPGSPRGTSARGPDRSIAEDRAREQRLEAIERARAEAERVRNSRLPAPEPSPAPPAAEPRASERASASTEAAASTGIKATIHEYEIGWARRDRAALQRIWLMPDAQARELDEVFREADAVHVSVRVLGISMASDNRAVVRVQETRDVRRRGLGTARSSTTARVFHLEKRGGVWIIVAIAVP